MNSFAPKREKPTLSAADISQPIYRLGWVNLYKKFEAEKYTVCGTHFTKKKWKGIF